MRYSFYAFTVLVALFNTYFAIFAPKGLYNLIITLPLIILGIRDIFQPRHAIKKNFPIVGHFRYLFEKIRPEINQYFIENNTDGKPFSREQRSIVYQRSKNVLDTIPFGTQHDLYKSGHEFVTHSLTPTHVDPQKLIVKIGNDQCSKPYYASLLNISAMSYGSLSKNAVRALNGGAKLGKFAHNTGEGGISPYHLENGGDLIWQIGTGYFGCRNSDGTFNEKLFETNALKDAVKMIEIKLSQGAKPGHGGILPAKKVSQEVADIRGVPVAKDVLSPPGHSAFSNPLEMMDFIAKVRKLSQGKPIGLKMSLGHRYEFMSMVKAMKEKDIYPDYIVIDGSEGGTGAAPLEFTNNIGTPGTEALNYVHNVLIGFGIRDKIRLGATGKITSGFDVVKLLCLGADFTYAARSMMLALGCIQALRCNANNCPTGVATQDKMLNDGLHVPSKIMRVKNFHDQTIQSVAEIMGAMGVNELDQLDAHHIYRRDYDGKLKSYGSVFPELRHNQFLENDFPGDYNYDFDHSSADSFAFKKVS